MKRYRSLSGFCNLQSITETVLMLAESPVTSVMSTGPFAPSHCSVKGLPCNMVKSVLVNTTAQHGAKSTAVVKTSAFLIVKVPIFK